MTFVDWKYFPLPFVLCVSVVVSNFVYVSEYAFFQLVTFQITIHYSTAMNLITNCNNHCTIISGALQYGAMSISRLAMCGLNYLYFSRN